MGLWDVTSDGQSGGVTFALSPSRVLVRPRASSERNALGSEAHHEYGAFSMKGGGG